MASLADNSNDSNKHGMTPIYQTTQERHTEIVKFLAPLTENPNPIAQDDYLGSM